VKDYGGIIVGLHPIPVDMEIVNQLSLEYGENFEIEQIKRFVEANRHNMQTTAYYLLLKKFIRQGGKSVADITLYNPQKYIEEQ
jgi:5'-AMP-activated protein kinase catalytic alpha subunit